MPEENYPFSDASEEAGSTFGSDPESVKKQIEEATQKAIENRRLREVKEAERKAARKKPKKESSVGKREGEEKLINSVSDNFRKLAQDQSGPHPDPEDLDSVRTALGLPEDFSKDQLERSASVANDTLEDFPNQDSFRINIVKKYLNKAYENLLKLLEERELKKAEAQEVEAASKGLVKTEQAEEIKPEAETNLVKIEEPEPPEEASGINSKEFNEFIDRELDFLPEEIDKVLEVNDRRLAEIISKDDLSEEERAEIVDIETQRKVMELRLSGLKEMISVRKEIVGLDEKIKSLEILENNEGLAAKLRIERQRLKFHLYDLYKNYYMIVPVKPAPIEPWEERPTDIVPVLPESSPKPEEKEKIRIVDVSTVVRAMAWRIAQERLNEIVRWRNTERGWGAAIRGLFSGRFFRGQAAQWGERGYLRKFYDEAVDQIRSNQNLMDDIDASLTKRRSARVERGSADKSEHLRILDAVLEQMESDVLEAEERGEDRVAAGNIFADLFRRHAMGEFASRAEFEVAAKDAIDVAIAVGQIGRNQFYTDPSRAGDAEGLMYANNLYQIAEKYSGSVRSTLEAGGKWEELDTEQKDSMLKAIGGIMNLDIQLGTKLRDLNEERPERPDQRKGYLGMVDRMSDWARSRPILGSIMNPTVVGFLASFATRGVARSLLMGAAAMSGAAVAGGLAAPLLIGCGLGGVMALARRRRNLAYDRGMEQRREALGLAGEGERAARLREFGFSGISRSIEDLMPGIESGDPAVILEAAALAETERRLRRGDNPRPVDLINVRGEEGSTYRTNIISRTQFNRALKPLLAGVDGAALNSRVNEIINQIRAQDRRFEGYRTREGIKAGAKAAVFGAVLGIAASEASDWVAEQVSGKTNDHITLLEYMQGQKPQVHHFELPNGKGEPLHLLPGDAVHQQIKMPKTGEEIDLRYILGKDGHMHLDRKSLPVGFVFNEKTGEVIHQFMTEVPGGPVNQENWDQLQKIAESAGIKSHRVGWTEFGVNRTEPDGVSWQLENALERMRANGTELKMNFHQGDNGSVLVDVRRMLDHVSAGSNHKLPINNEMLDKMIVTISPRDQVLQHDALIIPVHDGIAEVPKEVADFAFQHIDGRIDAGPGMMITADAVSHQGVDAEKIGLFSVAEKHHLGELPGYERPEIETFIPHIGDPKEIDQTIPDGPIAIPYDPRLPIGPPGYKKEEEAKGGEDGPKTPGLRNAVVLPADDSRVLEARERIRLAQERDRIKQAEAVRVSSDSSKVDALRERLGIRDGDKVKINTESWSNSISAEEYGRIMDVLGSIGRRDKLSLKHHALKTNIISNVKFNENIRRSIAETVIARDEENKPIRPNDAEIDEKYQKEFEAFIDNLMAVLRRKYDLAESPGGQAQRIRQ